MNNTTYQALIKWTSTLLIGCVIIYLLYNLASVILYLILAGVLALLGKPVVSFFHEKLSIPTSLAVVLTILLQITVVLGAAIEFPTATASFGTVSHVAVFDASTGGNMIAYAALTASKAIDTGDVFRVPSGDLDITLA